MDKIDIHSHILYGIDDGSKSLEESIEILKQQEQQGFKDIIVTSHYIENSKYTANNIEKRQLLEQLKLKMVEENININLYLGNEIYINKNIEELLRKDEISSLNNGKYLLIELPLSTTYQNAVDIVYELKIKGFIPIIAHPERYKFVQDDVGKIEEFIEEGALLQSNYGSIIGIYGSKSKKTMKKLLKKDLVTFLGTDIHYPNSKIYQNMDKIIKKITKVIGNEKLRQLTFLNPKKILEDKSFE